MFWGAKILGIGVGRVLSEVNFNFYKIYKYINSAMFWGEKILGIGVGRVLSVVTNTVYIICPRVSILCKRNNTSLPLGVLVLA